MAFRFSVDGQWGFSLVGKRLLSPINHDEMRCLAIIILYTCSFSSVCMHFIVNGGYGRRLNCLTVSSKIDWFFIFSARHQSGQDVSVSMNGRV